MNYSVAVPDQAVTSLFAGEADAFRFFGIATAYRQLGRHQRLTFTRWPYAVEAGLHAYRFG